MMMMMPTLTRTKPHFEQSETPEGPTEEARAAAATSTSTTGAAKTAKKRTRRRGWGRKRVGCARRRWYADAAACCTRVAKAISQVVIVRVIACTGTVPANRKGNRRQPIWYKPRHEQHQPPAPTTSLSIRSSKYGILACFSRPQSAPSAHAPLSPASASAAAPSLPPCSLGSTGRVSRSCQCEPCRSWSRSLPGSWVWAGYKHTWEGGKHTYTTYTRAARAFR